MDTFFCFSGSVRFWLDWLGCIVVDPAYNFKPINGKLLLDAGWGKTGYPDDVAIEAIMKFRIYMKYELLVLSVTWT